MTAIDPGRRDAPAVPASGPAVPAPRVATVRVNLLPAEITVARRGHKVRRVAVAAVVLLALVLAAVSFVARGTVGSARADLAAADALSASLRSQQNRYADVVALQDQVKAATEQLAQITAGDLDWAPLLTAVRAAAPAGVTLLKLDAAEDSGSAGSVGGAPGGTGATTGGADAGTAPTAAPTAAGAGTAATPTPVGVLTIAGEAGVPTDVAAFVDALSKVKGLDQVIATGVAALPEGGYTYGVTAVLTTAAALPTTAGGK